jgi:TRAP-type C4-dicarboxylate transport system permease large subunit
MAAIAGCAGFGAVCGSSLATASTMGRVALPELKRYGYSGALATGTLAAGGVLGILIPAVGRAHHLRDHRGGEHRHHVRRRDDPRLLAVVFFILTIAIYVAIRPEAGPRSERRGPGRVPPRDAGADPGDGDLRDRAGRDLRRLLQPDAGGCGGGGARLGLRGARRKIRWGELVGSLKETAGTTGMIYLIILGAELMKIFMSRIGLPQAAAAWIIESGLAPMTVMVLLLVALILLGCLMDSLSMILLVIPFFWPVLVELNGGLYHGAEGSGFGMSTEDLKIWFGILALIVVELGLITPPVGMNVFVISAMARDVPMIETFKGVMPFFAAEIVRVGVLLAFPAITLWLPSLL